MVIISKAKAKRLGIKDKDRFNLTKSQLTEKETSSGQYETRNDKTFLTKEARTEFKPETIRKPEEISKTAPTIKLEQKPKALTGLAKLREEDTITGNLIRATTDWRTTVALVGTLATLGIGAGVIAGAGAKVGGTAVITRTGTVLTGGLKGATMTAQRAFIGKTGITGINKIFHTTRPIATRFATNPKSTALTTKLLSKAGLSIGAAGIFLGAVGSYPFAGFIKEEALQTIGFGFFTAEKNNDIEGMEMAIAETDEILNSAPSILSKIPYANVLTQLKTFFEAVAVKLEIDKRTLEKKKQIETGEIESDFGKERRLTDEAAQERKKEYAEEDKEKARLNTLYFEGIRNRKLGRPLTKEQKEEMLKRGASIT